MNQDEWREVIQFLEPIDVFSSLLALSRSMQFIIDQCVVSLDQICHLFNDENGKFNNGGCAISFQNGASRHNDGDENKEQEESIPLEIDAIPLLGNVKYFVNLYLLKLAIRLGSVNGNEYSKDSDTTTIDLVLDDYQCKLLEFYRERLLKIQYHRIRELDPYKADGYLLRYITLGDRGIGKSIFHNCFRNGKYEQYKNMGIEFCIKTCTLPSSMVTIKHQVWDTAGQERFITRVALVDRLKQRFKQVFIFCFSMEKEESFHGLEEWFEPTRELVDRDRSDLIIGFIHPLRDQQPPPPTPGETKAAVQIKDAVRKAWSLEKSLFVQVDAINMKNVFTPFWFMQLKYAYFKDLDKIIYRKDAGKSSKSKESTCSVQ